MRTLLTHTLTGLVTAALVLLMLVAPVTVYAQSDTCSSSPLTRWLPVLTECPEADADAWFDLGDIERFDLLTDDSYVEDIVKPSASMPFFSGDKAEFASLDALIERAIVKAPALNAIVEPLESLFNVGAHDMIWQNQLMR